MELEHVDATQGEPPAEWPEHFQGRARVQTLPNPFADGGPATFAVHFDPGGRSRPHTHRHGQMLIVTAGRGVVGDRSGRRLVGPGDVVVAGPGEWHWHGATPDSPMTHVTVQLPGPDSIDWDVDEGDWGGDCPSPGAPEDVAQA
ncbi:MAG: cupin domain-containing protein [Actinomycetota bacterium]|nr:cupin domain-containing protein [Actinomycetota bacterium]